MLDWTIEKAKVNRVGGLVADATSAYSQNPFERIDFKCISEVIYNEYKNDKGRVIFPSKEPHKSVRLMVLTFWMFLLLSMFQFMIGYFVYILYPIPIYTIIGESFF